MPETTKLRSAGTLHPREQAVAPDGSCGKVIVCVVSEAPLLLTSKLVVATGYPPSEMVSIDGPYALMFSPQGRFWRVVTGAAAAMDAATRTKDVRQNILDSFL